MKHHAFAPAALAAGPAPTANGSLFQTSPARWAARTVLILATAAGACAHADATAPCDNLATAYLRGTISWPLLGGVPTGPVSLRLELRPVQPSECLATLSDTTTSQGTFGFSVAAAVPYDLHVALPGDSLMVAPADSARLKVNAAEGTIVDVAFRLQFAPRDTTLTFYVAPYDAPCMGLMPRRCLLVREHPTDAWTYFYDGISGFNFEPGHEYLLKVNRSRAPQVYADAGLYEYRLLEQMSRTPAEAR